MKKHKLNVAIKKWATVIGKKFVTTDPLEIGVAENTTFATSVKVAAILYPKSRAEVQKCVAIANAAKIQVYTVSSGTNWGYGSSVPVKSGSVVMNLKRMNKILELNEELAYVRIEAGVTQRQLSEYLEKKTGGKLWMDATASCTYSSVVGNTMERGHGTSPYCDHVAKSCNYEVVLANGTCIQTGFGAFNNSKTANLDQWGLGPSLDGIFSQSNLGVVTSMTVWLMPAAEFVQAIFFSTSSHENFAGAVDIIRRYRLSGEIKCGPHFGNVYTSLLRVMSYPWELTGGKVPLKPETALELAKEYGIGAWNGVIGLFGSKSEVDAIRTKIEKDLKTYCASISYFDRTFDTSDFPQKRIDDMNKLFGALTGKVTGVALARTYWRMKIRPDENPDKINLDRDRVGTIYTGATTPFTGEDSKKAVEIIYQVYLKHGYEPIIGIYPIRERAMNFHICLSYDRTVKGEDQKADRCQKELNQRLQSAGYYPHRLGVQNMDVMSKADSSYLEVLQKLKKALDPKNILSPGRYQ